MSVKFDIDFSKEPLTLAEINRKELLIEFESMRVFNDLQNLKMVSMAILIIFLVLIGLDSFIESPFLTGLFENKIFNGGMFLVAIAWSIILFVLSIKTNKKMKAWIGELGSLCPFGQSVGLENTKPMFNDEYLSDATKCYLSKALKERGFLTNGEYFTARNEEIKKARELTVDSCLWQGE